MSDLTASVVTYTFEDVDQHKGNAFLKRWI